MSDKRFKTRFIASATVLALAMLGLGIRLAFLHLGGYQKKTRVLERTLVADRGNVYDCRGAANVLALNLTVKDVCAEPNVIVAEDRVAETASLLAENLGLEVDSVAARLNRPSRQFAYIKRFAHETETEAIRDLGLRGVFFEDATIRYYPHDMFMCHVLGFVNHEGTGCSGVEMRVDRFLRGSPGLLQGRKNARRQELRARRDRYVPPLRGANVFLCLDQNVQYIVEKQLDKTMADHDAKGAWAIVQHVPTGQILAMASRPGYNPNAFRTADPDTRLNRAIGVVYEPGSTMKAATIAAALNEGIVTPQSMIDCENGQWIYGRRPLRDSHPNGTLTVADVLKKSSNIGSAKIALLLGNERLEGYFRKFGLGKALGIDLAGEENGILHPRSRWSMVSPTRLAIGQGVAATALQMLSIYSTIANDGFLMRPYVVKRVVAENGSILLEPSPEVLGRPITEETAATMRRLLRRVTEAGGTGRRACVEGYEVAGKTGTAQKPEAGGYSDTKFVASFVGFLPAQDPEIAVIVVVDEPWPKYYGGTVAAPAFSSIAEQTVRYLDVPPDRRRTAGLSGMNRGVSIASRGRL